MLFEPVTSVTVSRCPRDYVDGHKQQVFSAIRPYYEYNSWIVLRTLSDVN